LYILDLCAFFVYFVVPIKIYRSFLNRHEMAIELCSNLVYQRGLIEVEEAAHRC